MQVGQEELSDLLQQAGLASGNPQTCQLLAADLLHWFNVVEPDMEDLERLCLLSQEDRFNAWDCPTCGERVYEGNPEDWSHFYGADQVDYTSYPGGWYRQCDHCRCYHPDETCTDAEYTKENDFSVMAHKRS